MWLILKQLYFFGLNLSYSLFTVALVVLEFGGGVMNKDHKAKKRGKWFGFFKCKPDQSCFKKAEKSTHKPVVNKNESSEVRKQRPSSERHFDPPPNRKLIK